jgi:hypothetical protein
VELASLFLILAVLVWVVLLLGRPFLGREETAMKEMAGQVDRELAGLLAQRENILAALQELDFDFTLGKVPEEAYQPQRSILVKRGAEVLRRLDSLPSNYKLKNPTSSLAIWNGISSDEQPLSQNQSIPDSDMEIAQSDARTMHSNLLVGAFPDDDLEIMIAKRKRDRQEKSTGFCTKCGDPVQKSDRYCPKCGARIG